MLSRYNTRKKNSLFFTIVLILSLTTQSLYADHPILDKICTYAIQIGQQTAISVASILVVYYGYKGYKTIYYYLSKEEQKRIKGEELNEEYLIAHRDVQYSLLSGDLALRTPEQEKEHRIAILLLRKNLASCEAIRETAALNRHNLTDQSAELQPG